jgi:hypothetical protein
MTDVSQLFRALAAAPTWTATQPQTLADVTITPPAAPSARWSPASMRAAHCPASWCSR